MNKVWIVDDDKKILESLKKILLKQNYIVETADNPESFLDKVIEAPAVVVADIFFANSRLSGEDIVKKITEKFPISQCLIISGETDIKKTLSCLKSGALDFLEKPVSLPRLLTSVKNAFTIFNSKNSVCSKFEILGKSKEIQAVKNRIRKLAILNESVLITGESGTGKELVAENLHSLSNRYSRTMYKVNCTALNANLIESELFGHKKGSFTGAGTDKKGFFEMADKSSLFIDEIGDFDPGLQSKILRVLQEKKISPVGSTQDIDIDSRLIFATHHNLEKLIEENKFRNDLFFRISTFNIDLPPLRNRLEDIEIIAPHFLNSFLSENNLGYKEFSENAIEKLKEYSYPGNIRELGKLVKNAAFFCENEIISADDITFKPEHSGSNIWKSTAEMSFANCKSFFEKELILRRLKHFGNDIKKTSDSFGILNNNLYRKLKEYGVDIPKKK